MFHRPHVALCVAAVLAVAITSGPARAQSAGQPLNIYAILPLTGPAAFLGTQQRVALELGEQFVNGKGGVQGRPVHFVISDDQSNPQVALQDLNHILGENPPVILGSSIVASCSAMAPLLRDGPLDYCLSPALHPQAGGYVFTSGVATTDIYAVLLRDFRSRGWTRLAVLTSTDATGQEAERGIADAAKQPENAGIQLVERQTFAPTDVSVSAQIERIKAANPQALLAWTTGAPLATVLRGLVQAGLDVPVATAYSNMTYAQMTNYAAFLPKQFFFPAGEWPRHTTELKLDPAVEAAQRDFYAAFEQAGKYPDVAGTLAWDPMMIVVAALQKLGPNASAAQLRDHVQHLVGFPGINGVYDFEKTPQRGLSQDVVVQTRWSPERKTWEIVGTPGGQTIHP